MIVSGCQPTSFPRKHINSTPNNKAVTIAARIRFASATFRRSTVATTSNHGEACIVDSKAVDEGWEVAIFTNGLTVATAEQQSLLSQVHQSWQKMNLWFVSSVFQIAKPSIGIGKTVVMETPVVRR